MVSFATPVHVVAATIALATLLAACRGGDAAGAVTTAGLGVAGAGVYRATTGGCWGQCLGGLVCDRESGYCVARVPCNGKCAADETCEEGAVPRCRADFPLAARSDAGDGDAAD